MGNILYTRCTQCHVIFELSLEELNMANGAVRCGVCGVTFNARDQLSDEPFAQASAPAADDTDVITLPEPRDTDVDDEDGADDEADVDADDETPAAHPAPATDEAGHPVLRDTAAGEGDAPVPLRALNVGGVDGGGVHDVDMPAEPDVDWAAETSFDTGTGRDHASGDADEDEDADLEAFLSGAAGARRPSLAGRLGWGLLSLLLASALALQAVVHWRDALLQVPRLNPLLIDWNERLGEPLALAFDVERYSFVERPRLLVTPRAAAGGGAGADTGAEAPATAGGGDATATAAAAAAGEGVVLEIVAAVRNDARVPQPAPHLRLVLEDRWGRPVASRLLAPADYLPAWRDESDLMAPGEQIAVDVRVAAARSSPESFAMSICLRDAADALYCADR